MLAAGPLENSLEILGGTDDARGSVGGVVSQDGHETKRFFYREVFRRKISRVAFGAVVRKRAFEPEMHHARIRCRVDDPLFVFFEE